MALPSPAWNDDGFPRYSDVRYAEIPCQPQGLGQELEGLGVEPAGPRLAHPQSLAGLLKRQTLEIGCADELRGLRRQPVNELVELLVDLRAGSPRSGRPRPIRPRVPWSPLPDPPPARGEVNHGQGASHAAKPADFASDSGRLSSLLPAFPAPLSLGLRAEDLVAEPIGMGLALPRCGRTSSSWPFRRRSRRGCDNRRTSRSDSLGRDRSSVPLRPARSGHKPPGRPTPRSAASCGGPQWPASGQALGTLRRVVARLRAPRTWLHPPLRSRPE